MEHQQKYENKQKNRVRYVPDTDDEFYENEEGDDSDASDDSNTSSNKDTKPATASETVASQPSSVQAGQKRRHSDTDYDKTDTAKHTTVGDGSSHANDSSAADCVAVDGSQVKCSDVDADDVWNKCSDSDVVAKKRTKLEDGTAESSSDINSHVFIVCFVEHADHVTGAVTEALQKAAWEWFHVNADKVYVWQYNGRSLDSEHFVYLLNDIGKALVTDDRVSLQHLVFSMQDSDIVKFDDHIRHNATMDGRTRRALYTNIRLQVARNFEQANKSHQQPVCRYCRVTAGPLSDYVAFVRFSETAEFSTSASQGESIHSAAAKKSTGAEGKANVGKPGSKFSHAAKELGKTAVDNHSGIKGQSREILGEIVQYKSKKKKKVMPAGRRMPERKAKTVITLGPETEQTSRAGKQLAQKQVDSNVTEDSKYKILIPEVIETDVKKTSAMLVDHIPEVEPVDECNISCQPDEPDRMMNLEELDVTNKQDVPEESPGTTITEKVSSLPHTHEVVVEGHSWLDDSSDSEFCVWKNDTELPANLDANTDVKNVEFKKLSDWLFLRIGLTTAIHRFPTQYDLPVLGPQENVEQSVTWRLAEKFSPSNSLMEQKLTTRKKTHNEHVPVAEDQRLKEGKAASHVVFIGPYDASVIKHSEVVRRRVSQILDDLLPQSSADIFCVTDVGVDVNLTRVDDIVDTSRLSAVQFSALTVSDAESSPVSCVLLRFSPSVE